MSGASWLREAVALALLAVAGWTLLGRFARPLPATLRLGLAWPIGSGLVATAALVCVLTGVPLAWATVAPLAALAMAALPRGRQEQTSRADATGWSTGAAVVVLAGAAAALGHLLTAPFPGWDGAGIWGLKARALLLGALPGAEPLTAYSQPEYPLQLPLVAAWLGAVRGGWSDSALLSACWAGYVALAVLLAHAARTRSALPTWIVAAGVITLSGLLSQVTEGTADLTLAAFVAGILLCLQHWLRHGDRVALWVAAVLTGLAAWTKFEGVVLGGLAWAAVVAVSGRYGRRRMPLLPPAVLAAAIAAPWYSSLLFRALPVDSLSLSGTERIARLPLIGSAYLTEAMTLERWGLLWIASLVALALGVARRDHRVTLPATLLVGGIVAYTLVYLAAPHPALDVYLSVSLPRILLPLVPAATMLVAAGARSLWPRST